MYNRIRFSESQQLMTMNHIVSLLDVECTIRQALDRLNRIYPKLLFVTTDGNHLIGTITDGDIRRGLLAGVGLDDLASTVMNKDFFYISYSQASSAQEIVDLSIHTLAPILDEEGRITSIISSSGLENHNNDATVVIMAGGKGTRLHPYTVSCPKPMLIVGSKPILEYIIDQCHQQGFTRFILSVNYLKDQIIDYFGNGSTKNISIDYAIEDSPLGTAGSLSLINESARSPYLVLNGDVLTKVDYSHIVRYHLESGNDITVCVRNESYTIPYGVIKAEATTIVSVEEKPVKQFLVNAGIYVLDQPILELIQPNQYLDMPSLIELAMTGGFKAGICLIHEFWLDIGMKDTFAEAQEVAKNW